MADRALMMLEAYDSIHPLDETTKDFAKRLLNTAYQEGKLDGLRQILGDNNTTTNEIPVQHKC